MYHNSIDEFGRNQFLQLLECFLRNNQEKVLADYYTHCHIHLRETTDQYYLFVFLIKKYVIVDSIQIKYSLNDIRDLLMQQYIVGPSTCMLIS